MAPTGWTYYKEITIQDGYVDANLTDFPFLVWFDNDAQIGGRARSDGYDLRFTIPPHGDTELLKYEREYFNISVGQATGRVWVKVPSILATGGGTIRCYYGKADAADGEDAQNVWDANFKGVWHKKDITTSTIKDSTVNANNGTKRAANEPIEVNGKIDKAQDYDGSDDEVNCGSGASLDFAKPITHSAWIKRESTGTHDIIYGGGGSSGALDFKITNTNKINLVKQGVVEIGSGTTDIDTNWHYVVATYDSDGGYIFYLDGISDGSGINDQSITVFADHIIGKGRIDVNWEPFIGYIDELRISNIIRSAAWLKFEYRNVIETDYEQTWGAETGEAAVYIPKVIMVM